MDDEHFEFRGGQIRDPAASTRTRAGD